MTNSPSDMVELSLTLCSSRSARRAEEVSPFSSPEGDGQNSIAENDQLIYESKEREAMMIMYVYRQRQ